MLKNISNIFYNYIKTFLFLIITVILELGLLSEFNFDFNDIYFYGNSYLYIILFIAFYYLLKNTIIFNQKRLNIIAGVFSFIIALIYILSYMTSHYFLNGISPSSKKFLFFITVKLFAIFLLFYIIIKLFYKKINNIKGNINKKYKLFTNNKKSFFLIALLIFIAYIPYLINSLPGNLNYDFIVQINQALNNEALTNHHPYVHTLFIKLCLNLGKMLNSYNIGILIYTLFQVILSCFTFSFIIYYMARQKVEIKFRLFTLLFFMLFPIYPLYSMWLTKDIIFSLFITLITIGIIELCTNKKIIKSNKYIFLITLMEILE